MEPIRTSCNVSKISIGLFMAPLKRCTSNCHSALQDSPREDYGLLGIVVGLREREDRGCISPSPMEPVPGEIKKANLSSIISRDNGLAREVQNIADMNNRELWHSIVR